ARSGASGCVEVGLVDAKIAVRDSKDRQGPVLLFTAHEWEAFLGGARDGEFELKRLRQPAGARGAPPPRGQPRGPGGPRGLRGCRATGAPSSWATMAPGTVARRRRGPELRPRRGLRPLGPWRRRRPARDR